MRHLNILDTGVVLIAFNGQLFLLFIRQEKCRVIRLTKLPGEQEIMEIIRSHLSSIGGEYCEIIYAIKKHQYSQSYNNNNLLLLEMQEVGIYFDNSQFI